jgi:hypothetical protein
MATKRRQCETCSPASSRGYSRSKKRKLILECDELWSFVGSKAEQAWLWLALDADTCPDRWRCFNPISCSTPSMGSRYIIVVLNLGIPRHLLPKNDQTLRRVERNESMCQSYAAGELGTVPAAEFGISVQQIYQILRVRRKKPVRPPGMNRRSGQ